MFQHFGKSFIVILYFGWPMDAVGVGVISIAQFCERNETREKEQVEYLRSIGTRSLSLLKLLLLGLEWRFGSTKRD